MKESYFIKTGYRPNPPNTFHVDHKVYWNKERIRNSHDFQYHVYEYAGSLFNKKKFKSLLDIGAGPATKIPYFFDLKRTDLTIMDQPGMIEVVGMTCPSAEFHGVNLEDDLRLDKRFELIICADVIEHLNNPDPLLNFIYKHLENNGIAIISTPDRDIRRGIDNFQSPNSAHVREWNRKELRSYVESKKLVVYRHCNFPLKRLNSNLFQVIQDLSFLMAFKKEWFSSQVLVVVKGS